MPAGISLRPGPRHGQAAEDAEWAERSPVFQWLVRAGFVARAVVYAVIGALTIGVAVGAGSDGVAPNQQGALALIAGSAIGDVALAVAAVGLLFYALWKLTQGAVGRGPEGGGSPKPFDRISNLGGGIVYLGFFLVAVRTLFGTAGKSSSQPRHAAAGVLGWPGGPVLVAVAGVVLMVISAVQVHDAVTGEFTDEVKTGEMGETERRCSEGWARSGSAPVRWPSAWSATSSS